MMMADRNHNQKLIYVFLTLEQFVPQEIWEYVKNVYHED